MNSPNPIRGRRSYGTGTLYTRTGSNGRETWYGRWYQDGRRNRKIGLRRGLGDRDGLTQTQAEARLRDLIGTIERTPATGDRVTIDQAGQQYLAHSRRRNRKPSTLGNLESELRVHLVPFFKETPLDVITTYSVADLIATLENEGLAPKSVCNLIGTLSAICNYGKAPRRAWLTVNPCDGAELPAIPEASQIRWLTLDEIDLLIEHARPGMFHKIDRVMYRTAAMTGLRRGGTARPALARH